VISRSLLRRIIVAAIAIPLAVGMVYMGRWLLVAGLALLGVLGASEFYRLAQADHAKPLSAMGYAGALLLPVTAYLLLPEGGGLHPAWVLLGGAVWIMVTMGLATVLRAPDQAPLSSIAVTVFGAAYTAGLPAFLVWQRHGMPGASAGTATLLVLFPLVMTWVCDTFAMAGGAAIGGPKLAPVVSPKKTWAGAVAGTLGAVLVAFAYGRWVLAGNGLSLASWQLVALGLSVGIFGQVGDLAESLLKRSADVKDSGTFFPGHGGVMDRLGSLYWVIPVSTLLFYGFGVL
jgi:phosphatidate cytidylyltransferase